MNVISGRELRRGYRAFWSSKLVRAGFGTLVAALVLFHVWLLGRSFSDQTLFEPIVAIKWLAAGLLLVGLGYLRANGHLVLRGHRAGVFWLLVLLLHVQLPVAPTTTDPAEPATQLAASGWLWALPATVSVGVSFALGFGLLLLAAGRAPVAVPRRGWVVTVHRRGRPVTGAIPALACRPPPAAL